MRAMMIVAATAAFFATARAEDVAVQGAYHPVEVSKYSRMQRLYDAFETQDGKPSGLHMQVHAKLEPGDRPAQSVQIYFDDHGHHIPLFQPGSDLVVMPKIPSVIADDPVVKANLAPGESLSFSFFATRDALPGNSFTMQDVRGWMAQPHAALRSHVGFVFAMILASVRDVELTLPARTLFSVREHGQHYVLVRNDGNATYPFTIKPDAYPEDAVFTSTQGVARITLPLALDVNEWKRKE